MIKCPHCDADDSYVDVVFTCDRVAEYAHYTCACCGWEWENASVIDWHFDDDELLTVGMA